MDGSFACPECGNELEVQGLAPGRQVRCGFCDRLLEVPFLPRAPQASWRRTRFTKPWWINWSWAGIAVVAVVTILLGTIRFVKQHYESAQERSIHHLLTSSQRLEGQGRVGEALIELDAAIHLIDRADPKLGLKADGPKKHREELVKQDARAALDRLVAASTGKFPLGDWLGLIARADRDADLATIGPAIRSQFLDRLNLEITSTLTQAERVAQGRDPTRAVNLCEDAAQLLPNLPPDLQRPYRASAERLVAAVIAERGVFLEVPRGQFVHGNQASYASEIEPVVIKALEAKGYVPNRTDSPFTSLWENARYRLELRILERLEGNYLSSENRLTRIEASLTLRQGEMVVWHTTPTARTMVPLPNLPAYQSTRVAIKHDRSEELENMLYTNARGQIGEKLGFALGNLPPFQ